MDKQTNMFLNVEVKTGSATSSTTQVARDREIFENGANFTGGNAKDAGLARQSLPAGTETVEVLVSEESINELINILGLEKP